MPEGLSRTAALDLRIGDAAMGKGLGVGIAEAIGRREGDVLGGGPVLPMAAAIEERLQAEGNLPGVDVEAVVGG